MKNAQHYEFLEERMKDELVLLGHPIFGRQLWSTVKVRKSKYCIVTGAPLKGKEAFSPVTNGNNRMDRISILGMELIKKRKV